MTTVEDAWKEENLVDGGGGSSIAAAIPIMGLHDWLDIRKRIGSVNLVERLELVLLSLREVRVNLYFRGDRQQLETALGQRDLHLRDGENGTELSLVR